MPLTLDAAVNRPLVRLAGSPRRNLMLSLTAPRGATRRLPLNLGLVIDRSGSMTGGRLEQAKEAAKRLVLQFAYGDRISIVAYDDSVTMVAPSTVIDARTSEQLIGRIASISTGGSTALHAGWLAGSQQVAAVGTGAELGIHRVILLSDGYANVGETNAGTIADQARELWKRCVETTTMGIGAQFAQELLEPMAVRGGGRFHKLREPADISRAVDGELDEMRRAYARRTVLKLDVPPGVRVVGCLNGYEWEPRKGGVRVYIGNLLAGDEPQQVVLECRVPAGHAGSELPFAARAAYRDEQGQQVEQSFPVVACRYAPTPQVQSQAVNHAVNRRVSLLLAGRAREKAVVLSAQGKHEDAARLLKDSARKMSQGAYAAEPEFVREIAVLHRLAEQVRAGLDEHGVKELQYQSYLRRQSKARYDTQGR